jgi:hypothetical protein
MSLWIENENRAQIKPYIDNKITSTKFTLSALSP